jgi:Domain of unknown function (DUF6924)
VLLKKLPITPNPPVLRTDFSNPSAWGSVCALIREPSPEFGFQAHVDFVDDAQFEGVTASRALELIPEGRDYTLMFIVDGIALSHPEHPIVVVDLFEKPGSSFRVIPSEMWAVENNLSLANMDFDDFANSVGHDGIFRGFPEA